MIYHNFVKGKWLWWVLFTVWSITSCSDKDHTDDGQMAVQFTSQIKRHLSASRAVDTSWSSDDKVGISMVADGKLLPADAGFMQYQVAGSGGELATFAPTTIDQTLYYPTNGSSVNFVAFSPYIEPTDNKVTYSDFADQSTLSKMEAVDFLYHKGTTVYSQADANVKLTFGHQFSKLVIKAVTTDDATAINLEELEIKVNGMPNAATVNLTDGSFTPSSTLTGIAPYIVDDADKRTATMIVVSHSGTNGRTVGFSIPDIGVFTHKIASDDAFAPGKEYVLNFTVNRKGAELAGVEINDWVDDNDSWINGASYLKLLSGKEVTLPADGGNFAVAFETNAPVGVALKYSTSATDADAGKPDWITGVNTNISETAGVLTCSSSFTVDKNFPLRTCYAHLTAGRLSTVVTITQGYPVAVSANSIVLQTDGKRILIPVKIANDAATFYEANKGSSAQAYTAPFATSGNISFNAKVLWVDAPNFNTDSRVATAATDIIAEVSAVCSTLDESYLLVAPGTKEGNAVVCITKPDTNEIIWSWHIWVVSPTDRAKMWISGSPENTTYTSKPTATANNYAFFPLNLGAFNAASDNTTWTAATGWSGHPFVGLYYQWGRKDPITNRVNPTWMGTGLASTTLPYVGNVVGFQASTTSDHIGLKSIQNPHVFNWSDDATTGWQGTIHLTGITNNSWGYASSVYGSKSPFDPCPAGWRVPPGYNSSGNDWMGNAWKDAKSNKGTWTTNHANGIDGYPLNNYGGFHPATGYRNGSTDFAYGSQGYSWSAGPASNSYPQQGYHISFRIDYLGEGSSTTFRCRGLPVRCVAE